MSALDDALNEIENGNKAPKTNGALDAAMTSLPKMSPIEHAAMTHAPQSLIQKLFPNARPITLSDFFNGTNPNVVEPTTVAELLGVPAIAGNIPGVANAVKHVGIGTSALYGAKKFLMGR